ncbi:MAG: hypothetical protein CML24_16540 [Rhizobiales bacterium]|nr:hypothetical protein [Hyphomicrobiales bacterium]
MIRYLPILMLAFGLLLLSASFASAQTPGESFSKQNNFCADASARIDAGLAPTAKLGRCWKQMGLGILVPGCQLHAQLVSVPQPPIPDADRSWPAPMDLMAEDGPPPLLEIPPPQA